MKFYSLLAVVYRSINRLSNAKNRMADIDRKQLQTPCHLNEFKEHLLKSSYHASSPLPCPPLHYC
jgi:hypothetical protein